MMIKGLPVYPDGKEALCQFRESSHSCPDCPASRLGLLEHYVSRTACGFTLDELPAHAFAPVAWFAENGFGLVRRGVLIRERVDAQGRSTAVDAAGPGCLVSFGLGQRNDAQSVAYYAATDVLVGLCPTPVVEQISSTTSSSDLLVLFAGALERVERITQARGRSGAKQKIASLLCALADTLSPPRTRDRMPPDLQQRDFARLLGVRHETICRSLTTLEKEGLIERDPDGLLIRDRHALEAI